MISCGREDCRLSETGQAVLGGVAVHACPRCQALRSPDSAIERREVEPDATAKTPLSMRLLFRLREAWLLRTLPELSNKQARILDCGCGDGQWLEWLKDRGYGRVMGMETNPKRLARVHERGIEGYSSLSEAAASSPGGRFDVIFLWHVLEHVDQPFRVLKELTGLLAPDGVLMVSLPNHASLQTRLFKRRSAFVSYGHHLWFLDHAYFQGLRPLFPETDLTPLPDLNLEYEAFGWLDTLVSAATGADNRLHGALKKGSVTGAGKAVALILALAFLPVAGLLSLISLAWPRGGSTLNYCFRPACDRVRQAGGGRNQSIISEEWS